jgi:hypothetical protein
MLWKQIALELQSTLLDELCLQIDEDISAEVGA